MPSSNNSTTTWTTASSSLVSEYYPKKIFVSVSYSTTESQLRSFFGQYGQINYVSIPKHEDGKSKGMAFVGFRWHEDASEAIHLLHGAVLDRFTLHPQWARANKSTRTKKTTIGLSKGLVDNHKSADAQIAQVSLKKLRKAIMQARKAKKLTQRDLATAINEKPQVVGEYESGRAIPSSRMISKLERNLGVKLPRPVQAPPAEQKAEEKAGGAGAKGVGVTRGGPPKRR